MRGTRGAVLSALIAVFLASSANSSPLKPTFMKSNPFVWVRGGGDVEETTVASQSTSGDENHSEEEDFHSRVQRAMAKLGLETPAADDQNSGDECEGGVCSIPDKETSPVMDTVQEPGEESKLTIDDIMTITKPDDDATLETKAKSIMERSDVSYNIAMAALVGNAGEVDRAVEYLQYEKDLISSIDEDSPEIRDLVGSGFSADESRRALALTEGDVDNARAILIAEAEDAAEEEKAQANFERQQEEAERAHKATEEAMMARMAPKPKPTPTVTIPSNFDPTALGNNQFASKPNAQPVPKEDLIFDVSASNLFEKVIASPEPVLLDVFAVWCGPCKALTPALEQLVGKGNGLLRLGKLDTDQERSISSALGVQALPTVFGVYKGKILDSFQGMPTEESLRSFVMNLVQGKPNMEKQQEFEELSAKMLKLAALSQFSFAAREKLENHIKKILTNLTETIGMEAATDQAQLLRKLLSNITNNLSEEKFQKVNTAHPKLAHISPVLLKVLTSVGFSKSDKLYTLKKPQNAVIINPASIWITIGVIDKYVDENRYMVAKLKRQAKDDALKAELDLPNQSEVTEQVVQKSNKKSAIDPNIVQLKMRLQGLKKVHSIELQRSSALSELLPYLKNISDFDDNDVAKVQLTCAAKRLVINLTPERLQETLEELKLYPAANIVIKLPSVQSTTDINSLTDRAKVNREKKRGSHTMASVGIYSTEDNAKGELIDGGGGVLWEQDVSDTEDEGNAADLPESDGEDEVTVSIDQSDEVFDDEDQ